jgi:hypothetical protein
VAFVVVMCEVFRLAGDDLAGTEGLGVGLVLVFLDFVLRNVCVESKCSTSATSTGRGVNLFLRGMLAI